METINVFRKKKETGGTAATIDSLLGSLPTQSQLFIENIQKGNAQFSVNCINLMDPNSSYNSETLQTFQN